MGIITSLVGTLIMKTCEGFIREGFSVELWIPKRPSGFAGVDPFIKHGIQKRFPIYALSSIGSINKFGKLGFILMAFTFNLSVSARLLRERKNNTSLILYGHDIRDFIVPSRLQPGKFYALPQSPQQYKQLLMVAGLEKYFQIARCFRDEDPRHDRAYGEFTQLDLEMSYVEQEDILNLTEELFTTLVEKLFPEKHLAQKPWPRLKYHEVIKKYGSDKPDLRKNKEDKNELAFAWILNFPLFTEQSEKDYFHGSGKAKFAPSHHMFTAPNPDDIALLDKDPLKVRGLQHDLVLNGYEVGGGSIRIHDPKIQEKVFELIGFNKEQKAQFEHLLTAFKYGVPPHGGIAPGIDRLLMVLLNEPSLREVMAYPTLSSGQTSVLNAPSEATPEQLAELHIQVSRSKKPAK